MTLYEMKQAFLVGKTIYDLPLKVSYYARVSTEKEEQMNSLENQVAFFEDYIRKNKNWTFICAYIDEGITGTSSLKRDNFMRMIEDGKQKKFDLLVTKEVSRFSRDTIDSLYYTRKLLEYDVCVYFSSDNIITASNDGELRLTIMSSMAQDEVRKISERTKFGLKRAIEKGTVLGTDNIWGYKKEKGKLIIDETEAHMIKTIFNIYANSKIGLKKLSIELANQGFYNHNGKQMHQNTLKRIIQNPKYKGYYTGGISTIIDYRTKKRNFYHQDEWKIYKDYEKIPPIISEELWQKANEKLLSRSKNAKMYRKHQTKYLLSGKIFCKKHQCAFVRKIKHYKNKKDEIYWYCGNYHQTGKKDCFPACLKEQELYDILWITLKKCIVNKEEICEELISFYQEFSKQNESAKKEEKIKTDLKVLEEKKEKLLDLALDNFLTKEEFEQKNVSIKKQIAILKKELKELAYEKIKLQTKKIDSKILKETILKELNITKDNLEYYIEGLLDRIMVETKKENRVQANLKMILLGNQIIKYDLRK